MPVSNDYYTILKQALQASAAAKKAAYEAALNRVTTAKFDAQGNVIGYQKFDAKGKPVAGEGAPGLLDVSYQENKRGIETSGEASGTLRSGQQTRSLAENMAEYKRGITGAREEMLQGLQQLNLDTSQQLAELGLKYKRPTSSGRSSTPTPPAGSTGGTLPPGTPPPAFTPPGSTTPRPPARRSPGGITYR
jgi:hypothetical protein